MKYFVTLYGGRIEVSSDKCTVRDDGVLLFTSTNDDVIAVVAAGTYRHVTTGIQER